MSTKSSSTTGSTNGSTALAVADETTTAPAVPSGPPKILSADDIFAADDVRTAYVSVEEWVPGGHVKVRGVTIRERREITNRCITYGVDGSPVRQDGALLQTLYAMAGIIDEAGRNLFNWKDAKQQEKIEGRHPAPIGRIFAVMANLSGQGDAAQEELEGNSV